MGRSGCVEAGSGLAIRDPFITVPTITLEDGANRAPHADGSSYANQFSGKYNRRVTKVASVTICLRERRVLLPKPFSKSTASTGVSL